MRLTAVLSLLAAACASSAPAENLQAFTLDVDAYDPATRPLFRFEARLLDPAGGVAASARGEMGECTESAWITETALARLGAAAHAVLEIEAPGFKRGRVVLPGRNVSLHHRRLRARVRLVSRSTPDVIVTVRLHDGSAFPDELLGWLRTPNGGTLLSIVPLGSGRFRIDVPRGASKVTLVPAQALGIEDEDLEVVVPSPGSEAISLAVHLPPAGVLHVSAPRRWRRNFELGALPGRPYDEPPAYRYRRWAESATRVSLNASTSTDVYVAPGVWQVCLSSGMETDRTRVLDVTAGARIRLAAR